MVTIKMWERVAVVDLNVKGRNLQYGGPLLCLHFMASHTLDSHNFSTIVRIFINLRMLAMALSALSICASRFKIGLVGG